LLDEYTILLAQKNLVGETSAIHQQILDLATSNQESSNKPTDKS